MAEIPANERTARYGFPDEAQPPQAIDPDQSRPYHREGGIMTRTAITRTFVYAGLIAASIVLWWALIKLVSDVSAGL